MITVETLKFLGSLIFSFFVDFLQIKLTSPTNMEHFVHYHINDKQFHKILQMNILKIDNLQNFCPKHLDDSTVYNDI